MNLRIEHAARDRARNQMPNATEDHSQELAHAIHVAFNATDYGRLRFVDVSVDEGKVRLTGRVDTYYAKQLAQTAAMSVEGVARVRNDVLVK